MTARRRALDDDELAVLRVLSECAAPPTPPTAAPARQGARRSRGWRRRRVRGWMFTDEIDQSVRVSAALVLPYLAERGVVRRERIADPGRRRNPLMIYRITGAGEAELAAREGREPRRLQSAAEDDTLDADVLYLSASAWSGLRVLQAQPQSAQDGWVQHPRIQERVGPTHIFHEDLDFLIRRGLAERGRPAGLRDRSWSYRATPLGRWVEMLEAQPARVQVRVGKDPSARSEGDTHRSTHPLMGSGG